MEENRDITNIWRCRMIHVFMCNYNAGDRVKNSIASLVPYIETNKLKLHFIDNASKDGSEKQNCNFTSYYVRNINHGKAIAINTLV